MDALKEIRDLLEQEGDRLDDLYARTVTPRRNTGRALTALSEGRVVDAAELIADAHNELQQIGWDQNGGSLLTCGEVDTETVFPSILERFS